MIRLMGSGRFIDMPPGTLFFEFWLRNVEECEEMIEAFKNNPFELLEMPRLMIYQNNFASFCLDGQESKNDYFLTDINVVGDDCPDCTLRIVVGLDDLPEIIETSDPETILWTKKEIANIAEEIMHDDESLKPNPEWVSNAIERIRVSGNKIVDIDMVFFEKEK